MLHSVHSVSTDKNIVLHLLVFTLASKRHNKSKSEEGLQWLNLGFRETAHLPLPWAILP